MLSCRPIIAFAVLGAIVVAWNADAPEAHAADGTQQQLQKIEKAIEDSRAREQRSARDASDFQAEIERLRLESVQKARLERRRETKIAALGRQLAAYRREAGARDRALTKRRAELAASLSALQRLARNPPEALLASPTSAVDAIRSSILIGSLSRRLQADARRLGAQLDALEKLRTEIAAKKENLANNSASLERERRELDRLITRKAKARKRLASTAKREASRQAELAGKAQSLRALIESLEARAPAQPTVARKVEQTARESVPEKGTQTAAFAPPKRRIAPKPRATPKPRPLRSFTSARGRMPFPAQGTILSAFDRPVVGSARTKGIRIETLSGAQVVAPHDGEIVFAGPFRSYGQLLIIAHGGGYHTLVAGLSRIDVTVGQMLLAGEPVGRMAGESGKNPILYVEMRRNGAPFDPLPWLAALEHEVSG